MSYDPERRIIYLASALEEANATIRAKMDELSLVRRLGDAISLYTSTPTLSTELVNALAETINCRYALLYAGSTADPFNLQAVSSVFGQPPGFPSTLQGSRVAQIIGNFHTPIQIDNLNACPEWVSDWPFPSELISWLCVPLLGGRSLRGVLCLADDQPAAFDENTLRTLMVVVPQIASALANIDLYDDVRASEAKYRTLVENMHDVVFICEKDWKIVDVNASAERLFGESPVGRKLTEFFASAVTGSQFLEDIRSKQAIQNFEADLFTSKNERLVVLINCIWDGDRYSGLIKDVTERTRLVEQVIRAQKMESVGTLAAGVAHDFNNILGIILPNAELIKMRTTPEVNVGKFADVIINASKRANQLTKQLLSLSRREPKQTQVMNLNESVRNTCKLFEQTIGKKLQVGMYFDMEPSNIRADDSQVEQILLNLAINARDAMPNGGALQFSTSVADNQVRLSVRDNGTGIEPEILTKIFDPFFTTKDKSKGTGLGLSVVYSLIKQLGGSIDVKSEVGKGAEFVITFPESKERSNRTMQLDGTPTGGSEKILIVDDEPEMLDLLETALKSIGYRVVAARNGLEALEAANDEIHLIVMDMMMPVMDGLTAVRAIRQRLPQMKVLVASGYTNPENVPLLKRMGVEGFVQKPFELQKLAALIRDVLDGVAV